MIMKPGEVTDIKKFQEENAAKLRALLQYEIELRGMAATLHMAKERLIKADVWDYYLDESWEDTCDELKMALTATTCRARTYDKGKINKENLNG